VRHRLVTDGARPFATRDVYSCICGRHGSYPTIIAHLAEANAEAIHDDLDVDTMAYYVPNEPRAPAPPTTPPIPRRVDTDADAGIPELPPPPSPSPSPTTTPSIAEAFQEMLRQAFLAGRATAASGETFEDWYSREVLQ